MKSQALKNIKAGLLFVLAMIVTLTVSANPFTVNTTNDTHAVNPAAGTGLDASGNISFRSALESANAIGGTSTISVPAGTYNLSLGEITIGDIPQNITITGAGAAFTVINMTSTNQDRILFINSTGTNPNIVVSIAGLTFSNGRLNTDTYGGGAIIAGGPGNSLTLTSCTFSGNSIGTTGGGQGGAVRYNGGGSLTVDNCTFSGNTNAKSDGGALSYFLENLAGAGNGTVNITNSTFTNNTVTAGSGAGGGAIHVSAQGRINPVTFTVNILRNTFTGNTATVASGVGGAIRTINSFDVGNTMQIHYNRFAGNNAANTATTGIAMASTQGNVDANDNWWGCNTGPTAAGTCDKAAITGSGGVGTLTVSTWLQLKLTAATNPICATTGTSVVTASFLTNSAGAAISTANLTRVIGLPITFSATNGTLTGAQTTIQSSGTATVTFNAGASAATGTVNGVVDNVPGSETSPARASITINKPTVTNPAVTTGTAGTAFNQTFTAASGTAPYSFSTSSTLPTGLSLSTGGVLSGTPTQTGTFPIVVNVTDNGGCSASGSTYTLVINCQTITVTNPATATGTVGTAFSQTFTQSNAIGGATFTLNSGTLPAGLTLSAAGVLSGTPTQSGTFPITVRATDGNSCFGNGTTYTLVISCQAITVTNPATATGTNGTAFSQTFTQSGALGGATFSINTGTLPNGLTLSAAGVLSGTPAAAAGTYPVTVKVTDGNGCTGTGATYNLVISCQSMSVTNPVVTTGQTGIPFSQTFTQTGGIGAVTFSTTSTLPAGITLSTAGVLSGTPTGTGTFPIVVKATDANGCFANGSTYTLVITSCPIVDQTVTASPASVCSGASSTITVAASQPGVNYTLRTSPSNTVVAGPIASNGPAINFNTGNLSSATTFNVLAETDSNSVYLNGGQSGFAIPQNSALDLTNNFTVEGWIKPDGDPDFGRLYNKDGSFALGISSNQTQLTFTRHSSGDWSRPFTFVSGTWYHIAATYVSGTVEFFVNGTSIGTQTGVPSIAVQSFGGHIGSDASGNFNQFKGNIDNVRLWNNVRTASEIANNQYAFLTSTGNPSLVASWWIIEGTGNAKDYSANGINATGLVGTWQGVSPNAYCNKVMPNTPTVSILPNNSLTLTSGAGTNIQSVCINAPITTITYSTVTATGATITGLPSGVTGSWSGNVVTISGTPTTTTGSPFNYTVTLTGGCGPAATANGTITVNPNNTINLTSGAGTNTQSVCINTPITTITYATTGATGASFTGLPAGVTGSWSGNVVTISGSPNTTAGSPFNYTVTLTGGCGTVTATGTITVSAANTITLTSAPATTSQTVCLNSPITNITYSTTLATGATFSGLPAGVTGNWAANVVTISGTPTTATGSPFSYTVTLTGGCGTVTASGTITVNPIPAVNAVTNQVVCNGTPTATVTFSGGPAGTVYNWTNNTPLIGLVASGSGNIASFNAVNTSPSPVVATITVTPSYTNNSVTCTGTATTFTITVNPTPNVNAVANQTVCNNGATAPVNFTSTAPIKALVLGATNPNSWSVDVQTKLMATGNFTVVDNFNAYTGTPTLAQLMNYDAVLVFSDYSFADGTTLGNNLAAYVDAGKGVVSAVFATASVPIGGAFNSNTYLVIQPAGQTSSSGATLGTVLLPAHPTMTGVTNFNGGTSSYRSTSTTLTPGGYRVANWSDGSFLITAKDNVGPNNAKRVDLGFYPPSSDARNDFWVSSTDGAKIISNALFYAANITSGGTTTYNWVNNTPSIGLAPNGTGNIASFNAVNGTNAPVTATVTVTPSMTNAGVTCTGTPKSFTITVNPTATVNPVANQVVCNGANTTTVTFSSPASGGTIVYNWVNNTPSIGLAASGSGPINAFPAINTGTTPVVATITVTPAYTNNSVTCNGTPVMFTITVNPTPNVVATPSTQTMCSGTITPIVLTGGVTGTTYSWTRDNTVNVTGMAASGTGTPITGTLTNITAVQQTVTFTITPSYTNGGTTCTGTPVTATVIINATPIAYPVSLANGNICATFSAWQYARNVDMANTGGAINNYRLLTTINTQALISAGKMKSDGSDLRFLSGCTVLPFWIESGLNTTATNIWVKVPAVAAASTTTVNMVYGNPSATFVVPNAASNVFETGLVSLYTFTEGSGTLLHDWVGGFDMNMSGTAAWGTGFRPGVSSLTGFGSGRAFYAGNGPALGNGSFTVVDFAKMNNVNGSTQGIIGNYNNDGANGWVLKLQGGSGQEMLLTNEGGNWCQSSLGAITNGQWGMVGARREAGVNNTLFVNGASAGTLCAGDARNLNNSGPFEIGHSYNGSYALDGNVSLLAIYNRALSDAEITALTTGINPATAPTVTVGAEIQPVTQTICFGSSVTINLSNSQTGVNYQLYQDAVAIQAPKPGTTGSPLSWTVSGLAAGSSYVFTIVGTNPSTTCTSAMANSVTVTVNPVPTVNSVPNQVVCNNANTAAVTFTGAVPGTVYSWTNNTTSIGLGASGTGNIASFLATNATNAPVTATITVTPSYTNAGTTCTGTPITFTITVNPTPTVNSVANQVVCNNANTTAVTFSGFVPGTVYNWTNNTTSIGLGGSGTGNIASFVATNVTNAPVTATITVTPTYTNGGTTCTGTSTTFTITVNPTPTVNSVANQVVCNNANTAAVNFTGFVPGTVYSWTNNTPSIGLGASGTGNIASFLATNATNAPVTATITVTPSYTNGGTTCTGTPTTFTITVNPTPTVNSVPDQTVCNNGTTTIVNFTGSVNGTVFNWVNNTPSIGLAASGTGDINPFTATNATNAPVTATITVTPSYTNGGVTCTGPTMTFTITVNPTPVINAVASQTVCNNAPTTAVNFTSPTTGGTLVYTWFNNVPSIGLAASGTGNIPSFTAINNGTAPVTATITVVPSYTNNGVTCSGPSISFTITVNPTPSVNPVANQAVCNGSGSAPVVFTSPVAGTTYSWTNSNTAIGLGASGTGNIPSFTGTNAGTTPISGTITVTPSYTNGGTTCTGTAITFTITINPTPTVNAVANQTVCNNANTTAITFTGAVTGTVYNWTNNNTSIGLAASGTGNIASFVATNSTNAAVTATITVTPSYTNAGTTCTGTPRTFTITVNPTPTVNAVASQVVCNGTSTTAITFSGTVTGTVYNWTNNTPSIGLAASGSGNIAAFTAVNTGAAPVTATITVTPSYTNGGTTCTGTPVTFTITVNPSTVVVTPPANVTLCAGGSATFSVTATGVGLAYQWQVNTGSGFNNVPGATAATYTINPATAAMNGYIYRVVVTGTCGTVTSGSATLTVNTAPAITTQPVNTSGCIGGSATFGVVATGAGLTYQWQINTGSGFVNIPSANSPTYTQTGITAAMAGYQYHVIISGTCTPPVTSNNVTLTVNTPVAITTQPASLTICYGVGATFTVVATGTGLTYQWQENTGSGFVNIPGATSASYTISAPPVIFSSNQYRVIVTGACGTVTSNVATLIIFNLPNIDFARVPPRVCLTDTIVTLQATPAGGTWTGRGVTGGNKFSATLAGTGVSTLTYTVTNANGCISVRDYNITVNDCIERHNLLQSAVKVYPNPSNGRFFVRFLTDNYKEINMRIVDASGRELKSMHFSGLTYGTNIPINVPDLASGTYYLQVFNGGDKGVFPIVIAH